MNRLRRLVTRLPLAERTAVGLAALLDLLMRVGLVVAAGATVRRSTLTGACFAVALLVLLGVRRLLGAALTRRCRVVLYDAALEGLLNAPSDHRAKHDESIVALAHALFVGETFVATGLPGTVGDLAAAIVLGTFLIVRTSWYVFGISAVLVLLMGGALFAARALTARLYAETERAFRPVWDGLLAAHDGGLELVASGFDDRFVGEVQSHLRSWRRIASQGDLFAALAGHAPMLAVSVAVGLAVVFDERLRGAGQAIAVGDAVVAASAVPAFVGLTRHATEVARAVSKLHPLLELLSTQDIEWTEGGLPLPPLPAPIEWNRVSFAYPMPARQRQITALRDVAIVWRPGTILGLRGPNGSGKSTLLRLLLGVVPPTQGSITVGGVDLSGLAPRPWRRSIAYLPQRPYIPERGNIRAAVRLVARDASDEDIRGALVRAGLWASLEAHAQGDPLDTRVATLSVGERQRLGLARVLCVATSVVLLDEPDANLDAEGIRLVSRLIRELARDRMVAFAAHTPDLLEVADHLVNLEGGRVLKVDAGSRSPPAVGKPGPD